MKEKTANIDILEEELRKDILYQIDMQLYDEFNDKFCEIEENLGTVYSYKDLEDLKKAESDTERTLLREAVSTLIAENKELKEKNNELEVINKIQEYRISVIDERELISKSKVKEEIDGKFKEAKGLYERGVQPQAQYTMKLLRDLEQSLLGKE